MRKFGTPSGVGPKGAIVVVGLAVVGVPPLPNWTPPLPLFAGAGCTPAVALGALTPPEWPPPPLVSPIASLRWAPPGPIGVPARTPSSAVVPEVGASMLLPVSVVAVEDADSSLGSAGELQSGSSPSTSPSPSSSTLFEQAGSVASATVGTRREVGRFAAGKLVGSREADAERRDDAEAGQSYGQCELVPHASAPQYPQSRIAQPVPALSLCNRLLQATGSPGGPQRRAAAPNKPLINVGLMAAGREDFRRAGWAG